MNLASLTPMQLDALREIGNIGAGNAATALSRMLQRRVGMSVPQAAILPLAKVSELIGGPETQVWAIYLTMSGDLEGHVLFLLHSARAAILVNRLLGRPAGESTEIDAIGESALAEVGNILTASYLIAMGDFARLKLQPSPPMTAHDMASAILDGVVAQLSATSDTILALETQLLIEDELEFKGFLCVFPAPEALPKLLGAIGLWDRPQLP